MMEEADVLKLMEGLQDVVLERFVKIERFADPDVQMFERHTPQTLMGEFDPSRPIRYFSSVMINYKGRQYSQSFEIPAATLEEAVHGYRKLAAEVGGKMLQGMVDVDAANTLMTAETGKPN